ncbi:MAG: hypothetical protein ACE5ER_08250 [Nitrospinaceae bacterium]
MVRNAALMFMVSALAGAFPGSDLASAQTGLEGARPRAEMDATRIPPEPGWKQPTYRGWELLNITGLIATYYDLDQDRELDYAVIRQIVRKAASEEVSLQEAIRIAKFDKLSIYLSFPVIYFAKKNPMFYCLGVDYRKNCQNIWVDIEEDGLNGNETLYTLTKPSLPVR